MTLKTIFSIGGVVGRIPYIPQFIEAGGDNLILQRFFTGMGFTVFSPENIWVAIRVVNTTMLKLKTSEKFESNHNSLLPRIGGVAGVILAGIGAQIPLFALSWFYNQDHPWMVSLNATDVIMPIFSLYLLAQSKLLPRCLSEPERKALKLNHGLVQRLNDNRISYITNQNVREKLDSFLNILDISEDEESMKLQKLIGRLIKTLDTETQEPMACSPCNRVAKNSAIAVGLFLTIVQLLWLGMFTYEGASQLTQNEVVIWALVVYAVFCNAALIQMLFVETCSQGIESAGSLLSGRIQKSYVTETTAPIASTVAKVICVVLSGFAYIASSRVSYDYLNPPYQLPSAIILSAAYITVTYLPMRELSDWILQEWTKLRGSPEEKAYTERSQRLLDLQEYIGSCSPQSTAKFLLSLEESDETRAMLENTTLTKEDLLSLISA